MTYITQEQFNKSRSYDTITFILLLGLIFIIPILYSLVATTKNYLGFYGMIVIGIFCISYSILKYFKWVKKYKK